LAKKREIGRTDTTTNKFIFILLVLFPGYTRKKYGN